MNVDLSHEENSYCEWSSFISCLSPELCDEIVSVCRHGFPVKPRIVGEELDPTRRTGLMWKLHEEKNTQWLRDLLIKIAGIANERHFHLDITGISKPPEYVEYETGDAFDWHNDYGYERPISTRKLTVSVQLSKSTSYKGGDLEMFDYKRSKLPRALGTVSIFPSIYYHRVTRVTHGTRRALVAWLAGPTLV